MTLVLHDEAEAREQREKKSSNSCVSFTRSIDNVIADDIRPNSIHSGTFVRLWDRTLGSTIT